MIAGRKNLLAWFDVQVDKPYFKIFRKSEVANGNYVFSNCEKENETKESAKAYLDQCLNLISTGDFFMFCNATASAASKGRAETFFSLSMNEPMLPVQQQQIVAPAVSGISMDDVEKMADKRFRELMAEQELKNLKTEMAELKKENRTLEQKIKAPMNQLISGLSPYIGTIAQQFGLKSVPVQMPISGVADDKNLEDNALSGSPADVEEIQKAVEGFCVALEARYPDSWVSIVNKLTAAINNEPEKIDMALKFL